MKIGVFDSGIGGQSVANTILQEISELDVVVKEDRQNVPYGNKTPHELLTLTIPILYSMVADGCELIVIACNTVSTTIIHELRDHIGVPLIAMEPMIKPAAALTTSGIIAVCATPATLNSDRYAWLKQQYAKELKVLEPDCSRWSVMIEADEVDVQFIADSINQVIVDGADVIVLGCTHYHWIEQEISQLSKGRARVIQPEQAIVRQLRRELARLV